MQKRLKKEKKAKRKLQEALEFESKRREQVEQALKQATTSDSGLRMLKGNVCIAPSHSRYTKQREGESQGGRGGESQEGEGEKERKEGRSEGGRSFVQEYSN